MYREMYGLTKKATLNLTRHKIIIKNNYNVVYVTKKFTKMSLL